jgi:RNA polymerase III RPC4
VEVKSEDLVNQSSSSNLPTGKIGQLRVHASGKTVLSYGGIDFKIRLASDVGFAQDFVVIDTARPEGGKAWRLGSVADGEGGGWLIGVPDINSVQKR